MWRYARNVGFLSGTLFVIFLFWKFLSSSDPVAKSRALEEDRLRHQDETQVQVSVFYESLCPDSVKFVRDQMWPTYNKLKSNVIFDLVPYGKAKYHPNGKGWSFTCQHGPDECKGNKLQACAVKLYQDQNLVVPFVNCVMVSEYPPAAGAKCSRIAGLDWKRMSQCFEGPEGDNYLQEMGVRTETLNPPLVFVPWINLNGNHTDAIQDQALTNLIGLVCRTFKGSKPAPCS